MEDGSAFLNTHELTGNVTVDGHPASALRVTLEDGTVIYEVHIQDDIGQNASM